MVGKLCDSHLPGALLSHEVLGLRPALHVEKRGELLSSIGPWAFPSATSVNWLIFVFDSAFYMAAGYAVLVSYREARQKTIPGVSEWFLLSAGYLTAAMLVFALVGLWGSQILHSLG